MLTLYEFIKPQMNELTDAIIKTDWDFSAKLRYVELMDKLGFHMDEEHLRIVRDESLDANERLHAADLLIDAVYGDTIRKKQDASIVQQEEYPAPDDETVFYDLYRRASPDADDESIASAYAQWCDEYYTPILPTSTEVNDIQYAEAISQEELRQTCMGYLSEVMNFNKSERESCQILIRYDTENSLWVVDFSIDEDALRETLKNEWIADSYDAETSRYAWSVLYTAAGELIGSETLSEYMMNQIIPTDAYPGYDSQQDEYRAFLYCSTEERAAFSEKWKPIVDALLQSHPDIKEYYEGTDTFSTAYIVTRHLYGLPSADVISQEQAYQIAKDTYLNANLEGVSEEMITSRCNSYCLYDITNIEQPLWKVSFDRKVTAFNPSDHADGYFVILNAQSGEVIQQYVRDGQPVSNALRFAELYQ